MILRPRSCSLSSHSIILSCALSRLLDDNDLTQSGGFSRSFKVQGALWRAKALRRVSPATESRTYTLMY